MALLALVVGVMLLHRRKRVMRRSN
jgi:hypothetical protein